MDSNELEVSAKLKRLKIQEDILIRSLKHSGADNSNYENNLDYNAYIKNLFKSFTEIKDLFKDVQAKAYNNDILKSLDIEEIKNNILELEKNIRLFKQHLQSEIKDFKVTEENLIKQIYDMETKEVKKRPRVQTVTFNEIVPSPVKTIMNSPFKCIEVQKFQEFLGQSPNRYGGWNEYNQNIFKKIWNKYFHTFNSDEYDNIMETDRFYAFLEENKKNLFGVTEESIITHCKWYLQYLNLENRQKIALDKWRYNRRALNKVKATADICKGSKINKSDPIIEYKREQNKSSLNLSDMESTDSSNAEKINLSFSKKNVANTYRKATKQWIYRCNDNIEKSFTCGNIEITKKLAVPAWRQCLKNYSI